VLLVEVTHTRVGNEIRPRSFLSCARKLGLELALSFPSALTACTVNVYVVPLVSPVAVCVVAVELKTTGVWPTKPIHGVTT
jgi:hypothetical protein